MKRTLPSNSQAGHLSGIPGLLITVPPAIAAARVDVVGHVQNGPGWTWLYRRLDQGVGTATLSFTALITASTRRPA
jgi:hypothetical protein